MFGSLITFVYTIGVFGILLSTLMVYIVIRQARKIKRLENVIEIIDDRGRICNTEKLYCEQNIKLIAEQIRVINLLILDKLDSKTTNSLIEVRNNLIYIIEDHDITSKYAHMLYIDQARINPVIRDLNLNSDDVLYVI